MTTQATTHYELLGVTPEATEREIKRAFYKLLKEYPPEQKPKEYQRIREAYDVLSNPVSRSEYDNMASFGPEIEALKAKAEQILQTEDPDFDNAIRTLKKAVVLGPDIGILRNMLGMCYMQKKQAQLALNQFLKAVQIDAKNLNYKLNCGHAYEELGKTSQAEKVFKHVWQQDPEDYSAPRALANLYHVNDHTEIALRVLDKAIHADGKIDFQDFFCYYDKLHLLLFSGKHDELEKEIDVVVNIAQKQEEREFASFMLFETGRQLFALKVFKLAQQFTDASQKLNPSNEALGEFADVTRELGGIESAFGDFQNSNGFHELVREMIGLHVGASVGVLEEEVVNRNQQQLMEVLNVLMKMDPHSSEIKTSLKRIRKEYYSLYDLNAEFYNALIRLPTAQLIQQPCPQCGELVVTEKRMQTPGSCPQCHAVFILKSSKYIGVSSGQNQESRTSNSSNSGDCFIATSVYGTEEHPDVMVLRRFRDVVLGQYKYGRQFIRFYYQHGPKAALWLNVHHQFKTPVKFIIGYFVKALRYWKKK